MTAQCDHVGRWLLQLAKILSPALILIALHQGRGASGDLDLSFDPGSTINGTVHAVVNQPEGKILIGGEFTTVHGAMRTCVARLNSDGSTDETFILGPPLAGNTYSTPLVNCFAVQDDGKIILGGSFLSTNGVAHTNIARINPDGSADDTFVAQVAGPSIYDLWGGSVQSIIVLADGKLLVIGGFTSVNGAPRTSLARLYPDGTLDGTFNPILEPFFEQPEVLAVALQGDGKILLAGNFKGFNETPLNFLGRLNSDGSPDLTFLGDMGSNDGGTIHAIACQDDGKILIGGVFNSVNGAPHNGIARLNANGATDTSFQADTVWVYSMAIQSDGKILIGGNFWHVNGVPQYGIARLNPNGSLDSSIPNGVAGYDFNGQVSKTLIQADGTVVFGGSFRSATRSYIARLSAAGSLDTGFCNGPIGPNNLIRSVAVQSDQKVLVAGNFPADNAYGSLPGSLLRLNVDGSLDNTFLHNLTTANGAITAVAVQSDGKSIVAGSFTSINNATRNRVARLNPDGSLDEAFLNGIAGADNQVTCIAVQNDSRILLGGAFGSVNGVSRNRIARLNTDGSLDNVFLQSAAGASDTVQCMALQSDGRILIGGYFTSVNGQTRNRLARLNVDGSLDNTFLNGLDGANGPVGGLAVQPDGKILVAGNFTTVNGTALTNLARLFPDGRVDSSFFFAHSSSFFGGVLGASFGIEADGKIVVAMNRSLLPVVPPQYFFCLNPDGSLDSSFWKGQIGPNGGVNCLTIVPDGKLLIAGSFTSFNGAPRSFVARLMGEYAPANIQSLPPSQTAEAGSTVQLCVRATGYPPLRYQWFLNGNLLSGHTSECLELSSVRFGDMGAYTVVVNSPAGAITSAPVVLNVIAPVPHRPIPAILVSGHAGSTATIEYCDSPGSSLTWQTLDSVTIATPPQFYFDLSTPLSAERYYRAEQSATPLVIVPPTLSLPSLVQAISMTGKIADFIRIDGINQFGPTGAWFTVDTVALTNASQLYFDVSVIGQPQRLYRLIQMP